MLTTLMGIPETYSTTLTTLAGPLFALAFVVLAYLAVTGLGIYDFLWNEVGLGHRWRQISPWHATERAVAAAMKAELLRQEREKAPPHIGLS